MILTSGISFLGALVYLYLFTQRHRMTNEINQGSIEAKENQVELENVTGIIHM